MYSKNNFDFLRFMAATAVIVGHSFPLTNQTVPTELIFMHSEIYVIGVMLFFSISGYLITGSWLNQNNFGRFIYKRCLRIFPALIVVVILSAFVLGPLVTEFSMGTYFRNSLTGFYLLNIVLFCIYRLPGVFLHNPYPAAVNGSLWTLPVEFAMYLLTPMIALIGRKSLHIAILLLLIILFSVGSWYLGSMHYKNKHLVIYGTDVRQALLLGIFFLAGGLYRLVDNWLKPNLMYAVLALALVSFAIRLHGPDESNILGLMKVLTITYAAISFAKSKYIPLGDFGKYGDYSYGLYLYAFPIQQLIVHIWPTSSAYTLALCSFLVILPFAFASWHLIEKRMLALKNKGGPGPHIPGLRESELKAN